MAVSTPSTPGVRAPLDASVMRAASASHARSAISLRRRSNVRSVFSVDHIASLRGLALIIKGLHLIVVSESATQATQTAPLRSVAGFPDLGLLRGLRQRVPRRGTHSLVIGTRFPQFTCWTSHTGEVAYRSLSPCVPHVVAAVTVSRRTLRDSLLASVPIQPAFAVPVHTYDGHGSASCLVSGVGRGDTSTLRCVSIGVYSSTVPCSAWRRILA